MRIQNSKQRLVWSLLIIAGAIFFTSSLYAAPVAQLLASRISGVAPLAVHFDATASSDSAGVYEPFRQFSYQFNFGDSASGIWQHSGKSKNIQIGGPLAAHVYDQPGTYLASVTVTAPNGQSAIRQVSVTVQNPDQIFSNDDTVCLSRNANFSGCPSGAQEISNVSSWPTFDSNRRYLLRAGQDFRSLGTLIVDQVQTVQIGSFGTGAKPRLAKVWLQRSSRRYDGDWIEDVRVIGLAPEAVINNITGFDLLIYKNQVTGTDTEIHLGSAFGYHQNRNHYPGQLILPKNNFVIENVNLGPRQQGFGRGQQIWMGNYFDNANEHNIRLWQVYKSIVAHNKLEGTGPNPDRPGRSNVKIHSSGLDPVNISAHKPPGVSPSSQYLVAANNIFGSFEDEGVWNTISYKPQNSTEVEGLADAIIENNLHICSSFSGFRRTGTFGGRNITQRGSIVNCPDTNNALQTATSNNVAQLPSSWDGPYFINDDVIGFSDGDSDGIADQADNCPEIENNAQENYDNDSRGDVCDSDDDNDGMPDSWESNYNLNPKNAADANYDPDNDNLTNLQEYNGNTNPTISDLITAPDVDNDGVSDAIDNCPVVANSGQQNFDNDGLGDACDSDDDNDGMPDSWENAYNLNPKNAGDANGDPDSDNLTNLQEFTGNTNPTISDLVTAQDADNDGIADAADNCPTIANVGQQNFDNDGLGDACDLDDDNDGMPDSWESTYNLDSRNTGDANGDPDGDNLTNLQEFIGNTNPNVSDLVSNQDLDNDGIADSVDNCPKVSNRKQRNYDNDALGNACDKDDDNDGMSDIFEIYNGLDRRDATDALLDPDNDGYTNIEEYSAGTNPQIADSPATSNKRRKRNRSN